MWKYEFSKESIKVLENLDTKTANLLKKKIKNIGRWLDNRETLHADMKKLKGRWEGFYRLRVGKITETRLGRHFLASMIKTSG